MNASAEGLDETLEPPTFDNLAEFPPEIRAYLESEEHRRGWREIREATARMARVAAPLMEARKGTWHLLEFTPEEKAAQGGDPDIAFISDVDGWVLRMDYAGEIGPSTFIWRSGHEAEALEEWNSRFLEPGFALGRKAGPATPAHLREFEWALEQAVRDLARHLQLTEKQEIILHNPDK